jgi:hypothetical protein
MRNRGRIIELHRRQVGKHVTGDDGGASLVIADNVALAVEDRDGDADLLHVFRRAGHLVLLDHSALNDVVVGENIGLRLPIVLAGEDDRSRPDRVTDKYSDSGENNLVLENGVGLGRR